MKARIDNRGHLYILRGGKWILQECPVSQGEMYCGHVCPHFGEPKLKGDGQMAILELCLGTKLDLEVLVDRRAK